MSTLISTDPETDFPGLADLQSALLNESSNEDALFIACESLLSVALHDPGVLVRFCFLNMDLSQCLLTKSGSQE